MEKSTQKLYSHITSRQMAAVLKIQSFALGEIHKFFRKKGFIELPPVIISPVTDPLSHAVHQASIEYEGQKLMLTKSMIFHKQLSLMAKEIDKIYIVSPNVRLEKSDQAKSRHLIEFQQIDFEIKDGTKEIVYSLMEEFLIILVKKVKKECIEELKVLGRKLPDLKKKFPRLKTYEMEEKYGSDYEEILTAKTTTPFWLESFYREFYDKEDSKQKGRFINYDLIYPEGFEEGLSGGEREDDYQIIIRKMKERKMDFALYKIYLDLAKCGLLPKTAGAGFGFQRLLRYLTGIKEIEKVVLFPRSPREKVLF